MPTGYVKKLAKKHHTSVGKSEAEWERAKAQAKKQGKGENFAYITSIYKKIMGESAKDLSLKQFLSITERMDVPGDVSYSSRDDYANDELGDEEDFGDEGDDELGGDEDLGDEEDFGDEGEDEFDNHDGHRLADIVSDDELDDEGGEEGQDEFSDEDEFPEEDFPGGSEQPDENGEFPPEEGDDEFSDEDDFGDEDEFGGEGEDEFDGEAEDELLPSPRRSRQREGYQTKGSFLQELLVITEKKVPLKKAAKAVYHRDYVKTKKKPYRKYDPESRKHEEQASESIQNHTPTLNEKWKEEVTIPDSKKGMFKGRTKASLQSELNKLKASGPHHKGSAGYTKQKELNFAIRAKSDWK